MSIVKYILFSFLLFVVFLLLYKQCSSRKIIKEYEHTISVYDSISKLPPTIEVDTIFLYKKNTVNTSPVRAHDTVYIDSIKNNEVTIYITDTLKQDSSISRSIDYILTSPLITYREMKQIPVLKKENQKRFLITAGLGSNVKFTSPVATIGIDYLFDRWSIGGELIYNKDVAATVKFGFRF